MDEKKTTGIYLENCSEVTINNNIIRGFDQGIAGKNVKNLSMVNNEIIEKISDPLIIELKNMLKDQSLLNQKLEETLNELSKDKSKKTWEKILAFTTPPIHAVIIAWLTKYGIVPK